MGMLTLIGGVSFAQSTAELSEPTATLLQTLESKIKEDPKFLDTAIMTLQSLQNEKKAELQSALQANNTGLITKLTQDAEFFRTVSSFLNDKKQEKTEHKVDYQGKIYRFKSQSILPWISMSWGEDEYFTFPSRENYVQLTWSHSISGEVKNEIAAEYAGKNYLPKYYYAGENTLRELTWTEKGRTIGSNQGQERESYLFFDLPELEEKDLKNLNFTLGEQKISGEKLYIRPGFSAHYIIKEESPAFNYCKAVAAWKGEASKTKEYPEKDCEAAVKLQFSPEMHEDILDYAKHLYQK